MKNNCIGYLQYNNIYSNLLLLAGYDTMEEVSKTADLNILKVVLYHKNKQYGFYDNLNYTLLNLPVLYRDIQINSVKYLDKKYYINISYEDKLYCLNDMSKLYIDMEYVLDEKFNIIDVYNTNYKYIYNEEMN